MTYKLDVKKLFNDLRGPKGVSALTEEIAKVSSEIQALRNKLQPEAEAQIKKASATLADLQKLLKKAQTELDRELNKTVSIVKKYGAEAEKKLNSLKSAVTKKAVKKSSKKTTKKVAKKKTTKKA
jgi:hypothetical protein